MATRLTRRRLLLTSVAALAVPVLAACTGQTEEPASSGGTTAPQTSGGSTPAPQAQSGSSAGESKKLTAWQVKLFTQAANDLSKEQITAFSQEKGWGVEISDLPTDMMPKLMAGLESGDVPDIIQVSTEVAQLIAAEALVDVTPVVKELEAANGAPVVLAERAAFIQGKWWAVPWFMYADAWFARSDVLEANGLKPEDLTTYEQRRDAALAVSDPAAELWGWGITPKAGTGDGDILARHHLNSWGASITDETGEKVVLDSPEAVAAVEWLADIYTNSKWEKMLPPGVIGWTGAGNNENYLGGKIAFTHNSSSIYWAAKDQKSPYYEKTWVAPFPVGAKNDLNGGYAYYHVVFNKAKLRDEAVEIARHMAETKQAIDRMKIADGQSWPVYKTQLEASDVAEFVKTDPGFEQLLKNCTHESGWAVGWPGPLTAPVSAVESQTLLAQMYESVISGQATPADAVKETHRRIVEIFTEFGLPQ